jgi:hypothetical protein
LALYHYYEICDSLPVESASNQVPIASKTLFLLPKTKRQGTPYLNTEMINRRKFFEKTIQSVIAGCLAFPSIETIASEIKNKENIETAQKKITKHNIIFFQTDQQRWDDLGTLNPLIKTPNLDRLAKTGIIFRQATCQSPSCVPSRNSMMFGLYPSQLGILSNGSHSVGDAFIPCDPLPSRLQKAGYQKAGFGKTHWGRTEHPKNTRGFEYRVVRAKEVGMEDGAILYQDDENPQGLAAYRKETDLFGPGDEGVPGDIGATSQVAGIKQELDAPGFDLLGNQIFARLRKRGIVRPGDRSSRVEKCLW